MFVEYDKEYVSTPELTGDVGVRVQTGLLNSKKLSQS